MLYVVYSKNLLQIVQHVTKHKLLYNIVQYVQYCTKPCTISFSNTFFCSTTFQVVYGVQPFVQYCTTYVQCCSVLYRLYRLYNLLYNIVTVWSADAIGILKKQLEARKCFAQLFIDSDGELNLRRLFAELFYLMLHVPSQAINTRDLTLLLASMQFSA